MFTIGEALIVMIIIVMYMLAPNVFSCIIACSSHGGGRRAKHSHFRIYWTDAQLLAHLASKYEFDSFVSWAVYILHQNL